MGDLGVLHGPGSKDPESGEPCAEGGEIPDQHFLYYIFMFLDYNHKNIIRKLYQEISLPLGPTLDPAVIFLRIILCGRLDPRRDPRP